MGRPASIGEFGVGIQTAKSNPAAVVAWYEHTANSLVPMQDSTALPPMIGGQRGRRQIVKTRAGAGGELSTILQARHITYLLYGLMGGYSHVGFGVAAHRHTFLVDDDPVYLTGMVATSDLWADQFDDMRVGSLRLDAPAVGYCTCRWGLQSITPTPVVVPTVDEADRDDSPALILGEGTVTLDLVDLVTNRLSIAIDARPNADQNHIGSYYTLDITQMDFNIDLSFDVIPTDEVLYRATLYDGAAWTPIPYSGAYVFKVASPAVMDGEAVPYSIEFDFDNLTFLMGEPKRAGGELVVATYTCQAQIPATALDDYIKVIVENLDDDLTP